MRESNYEPPVVGDRPDLGHRLAREAEELAIAACGVQVHRFNGRGRPLPFAELRRERLVDDSVRACVDFSKVRLDPFGFLAVQGLDVDAIRAEFARRAAR